MNPSIDVACSYIQVLVFLRTRVPHSTTPNPCVFNPYPFAQVLDPQTSELSSVFVHASCGSKRVASTAVQGAGAPMQRTASGGEPLMGKIQRQLLLQVTRWQRLLMRVTD